MACLPDFDIAAALPWRHILGTVFDEEATLMNSVSRMPAFIPEFFEIFLLQLAPGDLSAFALISGSVSLS